MRLLIRVASPARSWSYPTQHVQFGQGVVADVDRAQRMRQVAGSVGDDERVSGIGLGSAGVEVGDAAHREAGQVGHLVTGSVSDRDRLRTDRRGLVDHYQQCCVRGELVDQRRQLGFCVGQWRVMQPLPVRGETDRVVVTLADIQAEELLGGRRALEIIQQRAEVRACT